MFPVVHFLYNLLVRGLVNIRLSGSARAHTHTNRHTHTHTHTPINASQVQDFFLLKACYLNICISSVHVFVTKLLLNGYTDFDDFFCVFGGIP